MGPMFWASLAALILGTGAKWKSSEFAAKKHKSALEAEDERKNRQAALARAAQAETRGKYDKTGVEAKEGAEETRMAAALNRLVTPAAQTATFQSGVPRVIAETEAAARGAAAARTQAQGNQMAKMIALGNVLNALQPELAKSAVTTGVAGSAMRGGAGVLQTELAQAKARAYSPIGDILSNLGSLGISGAIQNQKFG